MIEKTFCRRHFGTVMKLPVAMTASHIRAPIQAPGTLFLIQFPDNVPGTGTEDNQSTWTPTRLTCEIQMEFQAPSSSYQYSYLRVRLQMEDLYRIVKYILKEKEIFKNLLEEKMYFEIVIKCVT